MGMILYNAWVAIWEKKITLKIKIKEA